MAKKKPRDKEERRSVEAWRIVSRPQLALLLGVHADTVSDFTRDGMPVLEHGGRGQGKQSRYDAVACGDWLRKKQGVNAKDAAMARNLEAQANLNELRLARDSGKFVPLDVMIREGQSFCKGFAAKVRGWPRRARQLGIVTTSEQEASLTNLSRELLTEVSRWKTTADADAAVAEELAPA